MQTRRRTLVCGIFAILSFLNYRQYRSACDCMIVAVTKKYTEFGTVGNKSQ